MEALPTAGGEARFDNIRLAQAYYASWGVTTAQEGYTSMEDFSLLKEAAQRGDLYLDLVALGGFSEVAQYIAEKDAYADYQGRLKHAFFWGDVHVENLGTERAFFLSPMHSAASLGIHFANHSDYAVTPLNPLFTVWSAVNRLSRSGQVIGKEERISAYQALKAITLDGAWMYREESSKGSISAGKLADLVVLDGNPLTLDPMVIKDIGVVATYKEGKRVYGGESK